MNVASFKETQESSVKKFEECPLGRLVSAKVFDKQIEEYDKSIVNDSESRKYYINDNIGNRKDISDKASVESVNILNVKERTIIKEETSWSDEIIDAIGCWEEYDVYKNAALEESKIGEKKCLIRDDIDWERKDAMGRTNKERTEQGLSPISNEGKVIELHHIGQHADSPLAELTPEEHRGKGNDTILHDKNKISEIDRQVFARQRNEHWVARANESEGKNECYN